MNHRRNTASTAPCKKHLLRCGLVCAVLLCILVAAVSHAQLGPPTLAAAQVAAVHPEVTRWVNAVHKAQGPARYAALRGLWRSWEHADPTQIEEALRSLGQDEALEAAVRSYAKLLAAYARRRRGDLTGALRAIAALGFVRDWLIVGPFENHNRRGFDDSFVPELELAEPVLLDRSMSGKQRPVRWRIAPDISGYGWLDVGAMLRPNRDICAFASTYVRSDRPRRISLWVGAGGAFKLFWNDREVLRDEAYRDLDADRLSVAVQMHAGFNRITAKICGDSATPALSLRLAEPSGEPAADLLVKADARTSTAAASALRRAKPAKKRAPKQQGAKGPMQLLDAQLAAASESDKPAVLERYARYLKVTGGDAEASHLARDYARRAAAAEPTVDRLLLAASLAEDRNGRRGYVQRAETLVTARGQRLRVLLAQAQLARSGPNWLEAVPLYDDVLRSDPNNVPALLGRVDLYAEAGLPRTALATLGRALSVRPRSVALLRAMSGQLRALGRDTEAAEIESRYAALRFDDGGYLKQQLQLAVARRDDDGARRWAKRLLASEPGSAWAHGVVARSLRALGDVSGANSTYRAALEIAPDDVGSLSALADLHGVEGQRDKQIVLLKRILRLRPQAKSVRAYLEHIQPAEARDDEKYAWSADKLLELRTVRKDSPYEMRVLRRLAVTTVFDNGLAAHFKQLAFQPLTEAAAQKARQYVFSYHADRQVVQLRAAKIYRKDGRVDETVATGEAAANDPSINMYTLQRNYYVRFGRIEPGDVVELRYRIEDVAARNEMSDYFGEISFLQSTDPIASVEYVLVTPKSRKIHLSTTPLKGLSKNVSELGQRRVYRIVAKDVPPVPIEPSMPPLTELLAHVHVSTFPSWASVGQYYWGLASDKFDVDDDVRSRARQLALGQSTPRDKVAAIYGFVATEIRYVALELGIEGIRPRRAALTLARGWGDCKDKATLIVSMLRELGIGAEIVLVRTGLRGGFDTTTASLAPFDHAIVYVPSLKLYLDGTAESTGSAELPLLDRSAVALRVSPKAGGTLVVLPTPAASLSREQSKLSIELDAKGELRVRGRISNQGVSAPRWRRRFQAAATRRDRVARLLASHFGPVQLNPGATGLKLSDPEAIESPLVIDLAATATARREAGGWFIPMGAGHDLVARLASRPTRSQDLLVGPQRQIEYSWTLRVPRSMQILSAPKPLKLSGPHGRYELTIDKDKDKVTVTSTLQIDTERVAPGQYAAWRRFCQQVDAGGAPHLLIGKKQP